MAHRSDKHRPGRASRSSQASAQGGLSFLFAVNELPIEHPSRDQHGTYMPPNSPDDYWPEVPSAVMKFANNVVSEARGYQWYRPPGSPGQLVHYNDQGEPTYVENALWSPPMYSQFAVFACSPHLPVVAARGDPLVADMTDRWELLMAFHPRDSEVVGITQLAMTDSELNGRVGGGTVRYVAGRRPSWMPSLLPRTYANPQARISSQGLGGELPIVLGLMALTAPRALDNTGSVTGAGTNTLFLGRPGHRGTWHNLEWRDSDSPRGHPVVDGDDPRGFLVSVFLDAENNYSTFETLRSFEWDQPIVRES